MLSKTYLCSTATTLYRCIKKMKKQPHNMQAAGASRAKKPFAAKKLKTGTNGMKKTYSKTKNTCKVTFSLPHEAVKDARSVCVAGEFNDWNIHASPLTRRKDGSFSVTIELERGREYQFRYLIDDMHWENDWVADKYVPSAFGDCDNSVVVV